MKKRVLIVGGVAGGASCAARARRLSEESEIIIFERGPFVSFANCGLPYYIGKLIKKEDDLIVASPEMFREWFNIEVRTENNVQSIDRKNKTIEVCDLKTGRIYTEPYDALVLSPGAAPIRPNIDGIHLPGIFTVRTIPDSRQIIQWIQTRNATRATVVGAGFIGLEMTENLHRLGIEVTLIEMLPQVMPVIDSEMAGFIHYHLKSNKINLRLGNAVTGFSVGQNQSILVKLQSGEIVSTDLVILSIGVRPEVDLAKTAGLEIGESGGIIVNDHMQTSDENIWAVGDAVQVRHIVSGLPVSLPLAGPANRQGRIAADSIMNVNAGSRRFRGVQGTSICGILGMTIATTGLTEKMIRKMSGGNIKTYEKIYLHPDHHADYYPDAKTMTLKLIFSTQDGRILGAQAVGMEGVDKRIDGIAMAIQQGATVFDLEEAELCYAPQYGSAKDPINLAGMIASNVMRGQSSVVHWDDIKKTDALILDVREPFEFARGHIEGAINIPLGKLRANLTSLPKDRQILVYCFVGKRSYYATRILSQYGFDVKNISGGYRLYLFNNR